MSQNKSDSKAHNAEITQGENTEIEGVPKAYNAEMGQWRSVIMMIGYPITIIDQMNDEEATEPPVMFYDLLQAKEPLV